MRFDYEIIQKVWQQRCECETNFSLNRWQRWLYTVKATVCLIADREAPDDLDVWDRSVMACILDSGTGWSEFGTAHWWEYVAVGWGLRNWWIVFDSDGSP